MRGWLRRLLGAAALTMITVLPAGARPGSETSLLPWATSPAQDSLAAARQELAKSNCERAIELLKTACGQEPHWLVPHEYLAVAYQVAGRTDEARAEYLALQRITGDWTLAGRCNASDRRDEVLQAEAEAIFLINQSRQAQKLSLLRPDPLLAICAREHSLQMRDEDFCGHFSPTPGCRAAFDRFRLLFGYLPAFVAENIARSQWGRGEKGMVERVTEIRRKFMASSGHRRNTLLPEAAQVGVGMALAPDGTFWITELLALAAGDSPAAPGTGAAGDTMAASASED